MKALPVMAAHAAPVSIAPAADREMRRGLASVPVMYDLRFAVSTVAPTLVRVAPTLIDRAPFPLAILPPQESAPESAPADANDAAPAESTVAAIEPETPAVIPDAPAEPLAPKAPELAAIDTQAKPDATANWPTAETLAPETKTAALEPADCTTARHRGAIGGFRTRRRGFRRARGPPRTGCRCSHGRRPVGTGARNRDARNGNAREEGRGG